MLATQLFSWRADMVMAISIIRWVCHDPQLLGSLVSFDESSASISAAANYWDSAGDKRWREDGRKWVRGKEREEIRPSLLSTSWINHRIIYLQAQSARVPALLCLPNIKARFPYINNKLSLAFHLWAIKCHHIHSNKEGLHQVGRVARIS